MVFWDECFDILIFIHFSHSLKGKERQKEKERSLLFNFQMSTTTGLGQTFWNSNRVCQMRIWEASAYYIIPATYQVEHEQGARAEAEGPGLHSGTAT